MPFRLNEFRAKIQFVTSAEMPSLIYKALAVSGHPSNTVYIKHAVAEALARDLDIPLENILANLPEPRGSAASSFGGRRAARPPIPGPANTVESVR